MEAGLEQGRARGWSGQCHNKVAAGKDFLPGLAGNHGGMLDLRGLENVQGGEVSRIKVFDRTFEMVYEAA